MSGEKRPDGMPKGGAPKGNQNAIRHGLYSPRLAKGLSYPDKRANQFRREVEAAVLDVKNEISLLDAALIHSAAECQKLAYKNRYHARELEQAGKLTPDLILRFDEQYRKILDARDAKLKALGLDKTDQGQDALAALYGPVIEQSPTAGPESSPKRT